MTKKQLGCSLMAGKFRCAIVGITVGLTLFLEGDRLASTFLSAKKQFLGLLMCDETTSRNPQSLCCGTAIASNLT